jgi:predicted GTPase
MADVIAVAKANAVDQQRVDASIAAARALNPHAAVVSLAFEALPDAPELMRNRNVLVVEDGPSLTHGGISEGAGAAVARRCGARLVDPRPYAVGSVAAAYAQHPHMGPVLPALGYGARQIEELQTTIERVPCDAVVLGTPVDLRHRMRIDQAVVRVSVVAHDVSQPSLADVVIERLCRPSGG